MLAFRKKNSMTYYFLQNPDQHTTKRMKQDYLKLTAVLLLLLNALTLYAQDDLQTTRLFDRYGEQKSVTRVELNGEILDSYNMNTYRSLVFDDVTPFVQEIQDCLKRDAQSANVKKRQEVTENGLLMSAYYQLTNVRRQGKTLQRYILFKRGKNTTATLIYIEGGLNEKELMDMLYKK